MSKALEAALQYAASGWYVFPVESARAGDPDSGKRPVGALVPNGKLNATTDAALIRHWWAQGEWNIGIACEPSGIVVLDVDIGLKRDGTRKQGQASLEAIDQYLSPTLIATTGSGGKHAYYKRPIDFATGSKIGFADGLDLISNGYVVAAPSNHYSGGHYEWLLEQQLTELPIYLRSVAKSNTTASIKSSAAGVTKIEEGGRNNALFKLGAYLRSGSMTYETIVAALWAENNARFSPPLSESEVKQIAASASRVIPTRDIALGATITQQLEEMFGGPTTEQPVVSPNTLRGSDLITPLEDLAKMPIVHLPFKQLDEKLNGLALHSTTLIVAGTGKGKSSLAGSMAYHHVKSQQGPGIYYVGEMTRELMVARIIGQILKRSWVDVLRGLVPRAEMVAALEGLPLYFVKRSDDPMKAIIEALQLAAKEGTWTPDNVPMLIVDYIQLLAIPGQDMRVSTMAAVRALREFIEKAPVVGIVLSQSSRSGSKQMRDGGGNAEDMIGVGAETAELEQSATNQLVISYQSKDGTTLHDVTLMVAKSRFGGGSKLGFTFDGRTGEWTPTDAPPIAPSHKKRMDEMLMQITTHGHAQCNGGMFCGKKLNKAAFRDKNGPHYVDGNPAQHVQALEDLEEMHLIRAESGIYYPPNKVTTP